MVKKFLPVFLLTLHFAGMAAASSGGLILLKSGPGNGEVEPSATWPPGQVVGHPLGSTVRLTATPDRNSTFYGWTGDLPAGADPSSPSWDLEVTRVHQITAVFERQPVTLRLLREGPSADGQTLPPPGVYRFRRGDVVMLQALSGKGAPAPRWTGPVQGSGERVTVELNGDVTVAAVFDEQGGGVPAPPLRSPFRSGMRRLSTSSWQGATCSGGSARRPFTGPAGVPASPN